MRDIVCTSRDGERFWKIPECYVRGNSIKYLRLPDEARTGAKEMRMVKGRGRSAHLMVCLGFFGGAVPGSHPGHFAAKGRVLVCPTSSVHLMPNVRATSNMGWALQGHCNTWALHLGRASFARLSSPQVIDMVKDEPQSRKDRPIRSDPDRGTPPLRALVVAGSHVQTPRTVLGVVVSR